MAQIFNMSGVSVSGNPNPGTYIDRQTIGTDILDLVDFIDQDLVCLEDVFMRYPGLSSQYYEDLVQAYGKFVVILDKMKEYRGIK